MKIMEISEMLRIYSHSIIVWENQVVPQTRKNTQEAEEDGLLNR